MLAHLPEWCPRGLAAALGDLIFFGFSRRRRLVLSNLHHAFPDKPAAWHRKIGRESCRRLVETGLLSLALPFIPERRLRIMVWTSPSIDEALAMHRAAQALPEQPAPPPLLFAVAHLCCWESWTTLPWAVAAPFIEFGVIFRPLDNPAVDAWVKHSRERFGMRLLSRKAGFQEAMMLLRRRGCLGLLFDQNAGLQGALATLFGRVCSTSELAGLLAEKFQARVLASYPRRLGFWRIELCVDPLAHDGSAPGVTLALNRWLEQYLGSSDDACASWLWAHDRWRNQDIPARRLRLEAKRDLLPADLRARGLAELPRRTRFWIRLPNWLGDVVMTLPLLRAIRASRPDAEITLLAKEQFRPLLEQFGVADRIVPLPAPGPGRFVQFWRLRCEFPDCLLVLPTSWRGDLEAWLTRCRQRFGLADSRRRRPLLTRVWHVPADLDRSQTHQVKLWELFLRNFGLVTALDFSPFRIAQADRLQHLPIGSDSSGVGTSPIFDGVTQTHGQDARATPDIHAAPVIGLICGSENNPEKRWPVAHWQALIRQITKARPAARFPLFGTRNDRDITAEVARVFGPEVEDLAGRTGLAEFAARLAECDLLVTNDTGGMHLANALGIPVLALFGPTNPLRTGPVFQAPVRLLQPPNCAPTGGGDLAALAPETVVAAADAMLA
jgi:ADP-heptose:LPS heptosyltransferase/lauroyl/myristoyl acyltransferase